MTDAEKEDLKEIVEDEGMDYAFVAYSSFEYIKDDVFHKLRKEYIQASNNLDKYINE